jgi:hypothetical protein
LASPCVAAAFYGCLAAFLRYAFNFSLKGKALVYIQISMLNLSQNDTKTIVLCQTKTPVFTRYLQRPYK